MTSRSKDPRRNPIAGGRGSSVQEKIILRRMRSEWSLMPITPNHYLAYSRLLPDRHSSPLQVGIAHSSVEVDRAFFDPFKTVQVEGSLVNDIRRVPTNSDIPQHKVDVRNHDRV